VILFYFFTGRIKENKSKIATDDDSSNAVGLIILITGQTMTVGPGYHLATILKLINLGVSLLGNK